MGFEVDLEGIMTQGGGLIPEAKYNLRIVSAVEKTSKKGDPMVAVDYEVMDGPFAGRLLKYHYVVFFRDKEVSGAGLAKHYLKVIGQPHEKKVLVDCREWLGKCLVGKVVHEKNNDGIYARVKFVDKLNIEGAPVGNSDPDGAGVEVEDIHF
jgi:hypothetical protein